MTSTHPGRKSDCPGNSPELLRDGMSRHPHTSCPSPSPSGVPPTRGLVTCGQGRIRHRTSEGRLPSTTPTSMGSSFTSLIGPPTISHILPRALLTGHPVSDLLLFSVVLRPGLGTNVPKLRPSTTRGPPTRVPRRYGSPSPPPRPKGPTSSPPSPG